MVVSSYILSQVLRFLDNIFQILDTEHVSYANNTMLGNSIKRSESEIAKIVKEPIIFWEKLKII